MLVRTIRSDLTESVDRVHAIAVDDSGSVLDAAGEPDRPLFYRSAIKPLQAAVVLELGVDLPPEHLAVACSSHSGHAAHLAIVQTMLREGGLGSADLQTPPSWPLASVARDRLNRLGHYRPRPLFHNCSGKHAGFLRACVARGWDTSTYPRPDHPLQRRILQHVSEVTRLPVEPTGIDGCGVPTLRGSCRGLAVAFATMSIEPRYARVANAMHRFPALVSGNEREDGILGAWWDGPVKIGAEGLVAAGRHGIGVAAKSDAGSRAAAVAGIVEMMRRLGLLSVAAQEALSEVATPPVKGGGATVGRLVVTDA